MRFIIGWRLEQGALSWHKRRLLLCIANGTKPGGVEWWCRFWSKSCFKYRSQISVLLSDVTHSTSVTNPNWQLNLE